MAEWIHTCSSRTCLRQLIPAYLSLPVGPHAWAVWLCFGGVPAFLSVLISKVIRITDANIYWTLKCPPATVLNALPVLTFSSPQQQRQRLREVKGLSQDQEMAGADPRDKAKLDFEVVLSKSGHQGLLRFDVLSRCFHHLSWGLSHFPRCSGKSQSQWFQHSVVAVCTDTSLPAFESFFNHWLAVWPWASNSTFLCFACFICKTWLIIIISTS